MVAWQPNPDLPSSDRDDLRDGHYMRFTHELHKMGELSVGWADDVHFRAAERARPMAQPVSISFMAEQAVAAMTQVESQQSAA